MMRFALRGLVIGLAMGTVVAPGVRSQTRSQILTTPATPPRGHLESLNLVHMWSANLPMQDKRDGLHDVWMIGGQVLAQTRRGTVACYDAETGSQLWHTLPGLPFQVTLPLAWNNKLVFAVNNGNVHAINRKTGNIDWRFPLGTNPSGPMTADNLQLYIPTENRHILALHLPQPTDNITTKKIRIPEPELRIGGRGFNPEEKDKNEKEMAKDVLRNNPAKADPAKDNAAPEGKADPKAPPKPGAAPMDRAADAPAPAPAVRTLDDDLQLLTTDEPILGAKLNWAANTDGIIPFRPLMTEKYVQGVNYNGQTFTFEKKGDLVMQATSELKEPNLQITGRVNIQPVQHGRTSYIATNDGVIFAVDIDNGTKLWERTLSSPADRPLLCSEEDVFVVTREGLTRLDAKTGKIAWNFAEGRQPTHFQPGIHNVVTVNPKFVYAFDRQGNLHIYDRRLGRELASVNWQDFNVPIPNFSSDRLLLASHSGKLVCLRDREFTLPELHNKGELVMEDAAAKQVALNALNQKSLIQENSKVMLRDLMAQVASRHRIKVFFSDGAFRDINLVPVADKIVKVAPAGTQTLGEHLKVILDPLDATIYNVGGVFMVVPKPGIKTAPAPMDPANAGDAKTPEPGEAKPDSKPEAKPGEPEDPKPGDPDEKKPEAPNPAPKPAPKQGAKPGADPAVPPNPPAPELNQGEF